MSQYISFYLKSNRGEFLPIACFSRSNVYYEYAMDYVPSYDKCQPLTKSTIERILSDVRSELAKSGKYIEKYKERLALIASMNNSVEEKMEAVEEVNGLIDDVNEITDELKNCEMFYITLLYMIEEAEDSKYYSDKSRVINPDDYIYAGIECEDPNSSDEEYSLVAQ